MVRTLGTSSITFMQCVLETNEFGEITQNKGHYDVQGHSRSPIMVPIESSYRLPISN